MLTQLSFLYFDIFKWFWTHTCKCADSCAVRSLCVIDSAQYSEFIEWCTLSTKCAQWVQRQWVKLHKLQKGTALALFGNKRVDFSSSSVVCFFYDSVPWDFAHSGFRLPATNFFKSLKSLICLITIKLTFFKTFICVCAVSAHKLGS